MAVRDVLKISRKTFFNPKGWLGWDRLKAQNLWLWGTLRTLFTPAQPARAETFEAAMQRLNLTEEDVKEGAINYRYYALGFFALAVIAFAYAFYLLFRHVTITGFLLGLAVTALFCSQAFQYDFWSLQMRRRKLGLTFEDWKRDVLGEKGPSND
jgi:intracellular multiplication protein IcmV